MGISRANSKCHQKTIYNLCDDCGREISIVERVGYCARCEKNTLCYDCCSEIKVAHYYLDDVITIEKFCSSCSVKLKLLLELGNEEKANANRALFTFKPKDASIKRTTRGRRFWQSNYRNDGQNVKPHQKDNYIRTGLDDLAEYTDYFSAVDISDTPYGT